MENRSSRFLVERSHPVPHWIHLKREHPLQASVLVFTRTSFVPAQIWLTVAARQASPSFCRLYFVDIAILPQDDDTANANFVYSFHILRHKIRHSGLFTGPVQMEWGFVPGESLCTQRTAHKAYSSAFMGSQLQTCLTSVQASALGPGLDLTNCPCAAS